MAGDDTQEGLDWYVAFAVSRESMTRCDSPAGNLCRCLRKRVLAVIAVALAGLYGCQNGNFSVK